MRAESSWSLLSIVSSLSAAVTAVYCCSASPASSLGIYVDAACCCCSSISVSSFVIAAVVDACFCHLLLLPSLSPSVAALVFPLPRVPLPSLSPRVAAQVFPLYRLLLPPSSCAPVQGFPTPRVSLPSLSPRVAAQGSASSIDASAVVVVCCRSSKSLGTAVVVHSPTIRPEFSREHTCETTPAPRQGGWAVQGCSSLV